MESFDQSVILSLIVPNRDFGAKTLDVALAA